MSNKSEALSCCRRDTSPKDERDVCPIYYVTKDLVKEEPAAPFADEDERQSKQWKECHNSPW